jgi:hypothetical protein
MDPPSSHSKLPYIMNGPISLEKTKANKVLHIFYNWDDKHSSLLPVILAYIQECPFCIQIPVFIIRIVVASGDVTIMALLHQWNCSAIATPETIILIERFAIHTALAGFPVTPIRRRKNSVLHELLLLLEICIFHLKAWIWNYIY